jgi:tetratricopeptide (TPR) repeat protein
MKALEIDEHLAEAYNTLAYITGFYEWRWKDAEPYFKRAIELNPNYATAHQWYAEYLFIWRRFDEAIEESQRAQELDPLSAVIYFESGLSFYYARQFDHAVEQFQKALEVDEGFFLSLHYIAESLKEKRLYDEAFGGYLKLLEVYGLSSEEAAHLRELYNSSGLEGYYRWFVDVGYEELGAPDDLQYHFIQSCAHVGDKDLVFEWLEQCAQRRCRDVVEMGLEPAFTELRSDPRFDDLLRRIGLER